MNNLGEIAIEALKRGTDYFGEKIVGVKDKLYLYDNEKLFGKSHYTKIVLLENPDGSPCTSEIGIYIYESDVQDHNGMKAEEMYVVSGKRVFSGIAVTPSMKEELKYAERVSL